jgi:hypothetical protein
VQNWGDHFLIRGLETPAVFEASQWRERRIWYIEQHAHRGWLQRLGHVWLSQQRQSVP